MADVCVCVFLVAVLKAAENIVRNIYGEFHLNLFLNEFQLPY